MRDDQVMAQALCDWAIKNIKPPATLKPIINHHLGEGATNLEHMAAGLNLGINMGKPGQAAAVDHLVNKTYRHNFELVFRSVFEGLSVSYGGYNSETPAALLLRCDIPVIRLLARKFLRWDYTIDALCSTIHGRVIKACGRIYDPKKAGVYSAATDWRQRDIQGIRNDGWWPPKGVGPKFWSDPNSVSARIWRDTPGLPALVFEPEERIALRGWVVNREVGSTLRTLIDPIRVYQGIHVARVDGGHISWMDKLQSYSQGKNTAQPLIWAQGDMIKKAVIVDPPCETSYESSDGWRINGFKQVGFPSPQTPHIYISGSGPEYDL